jgi:hypothetical protein
MARTTLGDGARREPGRDGDRAVHGARSADGELGDSLGQTAAPREVSYVGVAAGVALVGTLAALVLARVTASPIHRLPVQDPDPPAAELRRARELYDGGAFAEARTAIEELARRYDGRRLRDYRARLARVDTDAALIARARGRLALGDAESALALSRDIAGNSPLYAEAWALARDAQGELDRALRQRAQAERDALAIEDSRRVLAAQAEQAAQAERARRDARRQRRRAQRANTPY